MPMCPTRAIRWGRPCCAPTEPSTAAATLKNAAYSPTNCAERTAFFKAVYDGHRDFSAIAVCGGKDGVIQGAFPPCGVCRQVMREFCGEDFLVYLITDSGYETVTLGDLLPHSFSAGEHMKQPQGKS